MLEMATYKQAYNLGDMLYKGSQLLRAKETEELRAIGVPVYSAAEQNKDGDINDKKNQTKESNADLHAHIFKKDMDNIYASDLIIANPERFAEGSIAELGAVETFNDIHSTMTDIVDNPELTAEEKVKAIQQWLEENPYKEVYVHLEDIRCTDIEESGYDRSFYVNQFVRGLAVAAQTGQRGVPVSQGGIDIMSWEDIIETLRLEIEEEEYDFEAEDEEEEIVFEAVLNSELRF
jgi:hypothetical protein